jgi:hypothetical protein
MRSRWLFPALAVAAIALTWSLVNLKPAPAPATAVLATPATQLRVPEPTAPSGSVPAMPASPPVPDAVRVESEAAPLHVSAVGATGGAAPSGLPPGIVLENMRTVFHQYNSRFGGNPVGTNPEITASLDGGNPDHVVFLNSEDGMRINERGELVDSWGTPFFFHQLSRTEMEIRSAGPDRTLWTDDDLVIR